MKVGDMVTFRGHPTVRDGTEAQIVAVGPPYDDMDPDERIAEVFVSEERYVGPEWLARIGHGRVRVRFLASGVREDGTVS